MEVCYRHPNRETGVRCSNCDRPICPDCMTTTPVGMRCPECARQRTRTRGVSGLGGEPSLTYLLIGINVVVALGTTLGGASTTGNSFGGSSLLSDGSVSRATIADGEYWRLLTAGFLHLNLFPHLLFNMFSLYILGSMLEPAIGRLRFGLIYFVSLLAGSFGALLLTATEPTVGASGAIFGLLAAAAVVMRSRGMGIMESGLGIWIIINFAFTFYASNISVGGHLGGFVGGGVAALLLFELRDRVRVPELVPAALCVALGVAAVAGAIAVSSS